MKEGYIAATWKAKRWQSAGITLNGPKDCDNLKNYTTKTRSQPHRPSLQRLVFNLCAGDSYKTQRTQHPVTQVDFAYIKANQEPRPTQGLSAVDVATQLCAACLVPDKPSMTDCMFKKMSGAHSQVQRNYRTQRRSYLHLVLERNVHATEQTLATTQSHVRTSHASVAGLLGASSGRQPNFYTSPKKYCYILDSIAASLMPFCRGGFSARVMAEGD